MGAPKKLTARPTKRMPKPAQDRLDQLGEDAVIERIASGASWRSLAEEVGIGMSAFAAWLSRTPERFARAQAARETAAHWHAQEALDTLLHADTSDSVAFARAREISQHHRWAAKVMSPRSYGEKLQQEVTGAEGAPLAVAITFK